MQNKLFFFGDFQELIDHRGQTYLLSVPTVLQRGGILTEGNQGIIYNPNSGQPFANNTISPGQINSIALGVANLYPLPNLPGTDGGIANNYVTNTVNTETVPQFDLKMDWQASAKDRVFGRESFAHRSFTSPSPGNEFMFGGPYSNPQDQNAVLGWDRTLSVNKTNSFRIGFNRYNTVDFANSYGTGKNNQLGTPKRQYPRSAL